MLLCRYRGLLRKAVTGKSEKDRNIYVLRMGFGKRKILFAGAIHGREYVTAGFLFRSIEEYAKAYAKEKSISDISMERLFREYSFYVVPVSNPDSVEIALGLDEPVDKSEDFLSYTYKDNARGVNLNANFPYLWNSVPKSRNPGSRAASEKETKFLINLCETNKFEKLLTLHSRGGCIYWRDKGNGEIYGDLALAERISDKCGLKLCPVTERKEDYSGGFENWFRYRYKKPALCVELVSDENAPFDLCVKDFYNCTDWDNTKYLFSQTVC